MPDMVEMQPCLISKPNNINDKSTSPPNNIVRAMTTLTANVMTSMLSNVSNIASKSSLCGPYNSKEHHHC